MPALAQIKKVESTTDAEGPGSEDNGEKTRMADTGGRGEKRMADTQSSDSVVVAAQRPRLSAGAPPPSSQVPGKPEKLWESFETSAAGSPIQTMMNEVVPYVDHVLLRRMSSFFFCKWKSEFSQKTVIDESHPSPQPNFGQC